jgi:hypothetical protein
LFYPLQQHEATHDIFIVIDISLLLLRKFDIPLFNSIQWEFTVDKPAKQTLLLSLRLVGLLVGLLVRLLVRLLIRLLDRLRL